MQTLTYLISFIALGVLARAFFSWEKDDTNVFAEEYRQEFVQESPVLTTPVEEIATETVIPEPEFPALIFNEVDNSPLIIDNWPLPSSINHKVGFFSQAPDGNRNLPRQEACEEASIALANYFIKGKWLDKDLMRSDILALVDRQMELFGDYLHTTIEQTKQLYEDFYGWESYIIDNPTIEQIKSILAQWQIIVAPFAGRKLGNPYYSGKGPVYHMMVLRWYDDTSIYTNDVGTSRGENYRYSYATILDANRDRADDINQWAKRMLVIVK